MNLFYYLFNAYSVVVILLASIIIFAALVWFLTKGEYNRKKKIIICCVCFVVIQALSFSILLYDFPKKPEVDITPLQRIGDAYIADFENKQLPLEESVYFMRKNKFAYNFRFRYQDEPTVELTVYPFNNIESALDNMLIAAKVDLGQVRKLSESVYLYITDSKMWRSRSTFFSDDLARVQNTYIVIGDILFVLRENGVGELIGDTTSKVIGIIYDTLISA